LDELSAGFKELSREFIEMREGIAAMKVQAILGKDENE
jgi:hypothetical protein